MVGASTLVNAGEQIVRAEEPAAAALRELDAILALPNEAISVEQLSSIRDIMQLPSHLRPDLPQTFRNNDPLEQAIRNRWGGAAPVPARELDNLRIDQARRTLEAQPGTTRAGLEAELSSIIAKPNASITDRDTWRMATLARVREDLRPSILANDGPWGYQGLDQLGLFPWDPEQITMRATIDHLRLREQALALAADATTTRESTTRELVGLLARPPHEVDDTMLRRIGVLARLPEHVRPPIPADVNRDLRLSDLGIRERHPNGDFDAATVYAAAREHVLASVDSTLLVDEIRRLVDAGSSLDLRTIDALAQRDPALLEAAGLTPSVLQERALAALKGRRPARLDQVEDQLRLVHVRVADARPADGAQAGLQRETLELIDRNLARVRGDLHDGYKQFPDYAELGRIAEGGRLLNAITGSAPEPTGAVEAARTGAEVIAW